MDKMRLLASLDIDVYLDETSTSGALTDEVYEKLCEPMIDDIGDSVSECVNRLREKYPDLYIEINGVC